MFTLRLLDRMDQVIRFSNAGYRGHLLRRTRQRAKNKSSKAERFEGRSLDEDICKERERKKKLEELLTIFAGFFKCSMCYPLLGR